MKIDIKEYIVEETKTKKAALADMGLSIDDHAIYEGRFTNTVSGNGRHSNFFAGDYDNAIDGLSQLEEYEDVADCGDEWYLD